MAVPLLSAKDLYKEYKTKEGLCIAVDHVDFNMVPGDFISVIGASGSGKSSLLYLLSGMADMTAGEVFYKGKSLSGMSGKQKARYRGSEVGFVFQDGNLLDELTVLKNAALPGYLYGKGKDVDGLAGRLLDFLGLGNHKSKYPNELSGGQRQRAAIARALVNRPKIIFLDEPTGSLDAPTGERVLQLLVKLNERGQSIVMASHDMGAAARGSKVVMVREGRIYKSLVLGRYAGGELEGRKAKIYNALEGAGKRQP